MHLTHLEATAGQVIIDKEAVIDCQFYYKICWNLGQLSVEEEANW